ncbi:MAG: 16S rRNA (guanine(966)-N(2))-methyltransferase RsmD [Prolixibacteraceae bacterium]|jgi:16S rRNA (guanine(966)-N(2))-methyltransferase RsmD|nr:16S rRNA (guanine(966)-N(2))-methyltransferase RsmD [Prolixibacteraceae bacterium]
MRIVGGKYKGRHFTPGKNFKARPTTDMAKESLFNILQNLIDFEKIKVLDLFAGTGSISFEFASRGCTDITAVEINFNHCNFIKETIAKLNETNIRLVKTNAFVFAAHFKEQYDLIFADPPYDMQNFAEVPGLVFRNGLLRKGGLFILEHSGNYDFSKLPQFRELRRYGSVHFSFFHTPPNS